MKIRKFCEMILITRKLKFFFGILNSRLSSEKNIAQVPHTHNPESIFIFNFHSFHKQTFHTINSNDEKEEHAQKLRHFEKKYVSDNQSRC